MIELIGRRTVRARNSSDVEVGSLERAEGLRSAGGENVRLGHLSDFHLGKPLDTGEVPTIVEAWLEYFGEAGVDAVVYTGDAVETPDDRVGMLRIRQLLDDSGIPWVAVPGNHDVARPGCSRAFYEIFGEYPRVERVGGVECILLDSMGGLPVAERSPFDWLEAGRTGSYSKGRVGPEQLDRAARQLGDSDAPRILAVHHHLAAAEAVVDDPTGSSAPDALMVPCLDADDVLRWAREHGVAAVFHGHMHPHWPPYAPDGGPVVFNSGSSTRGKPDPRARIVDLAPSGEHRVWELEQT